MTQLLMPLECTIEGDNNYPNETTRRMVALDFADMCETQNPLFNRTRFLKACGVKE